MKDMQGQKDTNFGNQNWSSQWKRMLVLPLTYHPFSCHWSIGYFYHATIDKLTVQSALLRNFFNFYLKKL